MANINITSNSAAYTGTNGDDIFTRSNSNLKDITVVGLEGDDTLALGSAAAPGTGVGGLGLGFSLASSTVLMGAGDDLYTFSGQAGSGFARQNSTLVEMGAGDDFALINGLASASGAIVKGNADNDEIGFLNAVSGGTAFRTLLEGNAGNDSITASWTGTVAKNFEIYGGQGSDTISATFGNVSAFAQATAFVSGLYVAGGKGADAIGTNILATSENIVIAGNSGNDTINFTAFGALSGSQIFGGHDNDSISAQLSQGTAQAITVAGGLGDDVVNVNSIGAGDVWSGVQILGNSGSDVLSLNVATGASLSAATANSMLGGSGSDTINVFIATGATLTVAGQSGFVASLGTEASGGVIYVDVDGSLQGPAVFQGSTGADTITVHSHTGGLISGSIISAEAGADLIVIDNYLSATMRGVVANGGGGADTITATLIGNGGYYVTGGSNVFDGGADSDSIQLNVATGAGVTAVSILGGLGADTIGVNLASAGGIASMGNTAGRNFSIAGGSGADLIGLAGLTGSFANAEILGGSGADTITGTFTNNGAVALSAVGGLGNDSMSFLSQGSAGNFAGSVFDGGSAADTISIAFSGRKTAAANFGTIIGGSGVDSLVVSVAGLGGTAGFAGTAKGLIGTFNAGEGADSISVLGLTGNVSNQLTGGSISLASGDSLVGGFDTYFFSTTAGNAALSGVDVNFSGFANAAFAKVASVGTAGAFLASFSGGKGATIAVAATGGAITFNASAGGGVARSAGTFSIRAGGATNTADIISAVDRVVVGVNSVAVFNIQDGTAGAVNGYMFIQGGVNPDSVIRLNGLAQRNTGGLVSADLMFRAGSAGNFILANAGQGGSGGITFGGAL